MAGRPRKTKPGTVSQAAPRSQAALSLDPLTVCKDINEWPRSWMGFPEDVPRGEHIVEPESAECPWRQLQFLAEHSS
jgi:hypothetical protein